MKKFLPASKFKNSNPDFKYSVGAEGIRTSADCGFGRDAVEPLGTVAKSSPPPSDFGHQIVRAERYNLLAEARDILLKEGQRQELRWWHKVHRTAGCKYLKHTKEGVGLKHDPKHAKSFYTGVQTCGSVWACPLCSSKIQERRREEIAQGMDWAYGRGLKAVMVTLTFPHRKFQKLPDLLGMQKDALERLRKGDIWDRFKVRINFEGLIRSLELTYGDKNGWHPHTHELWFVDKNADADHIKSVVLKKWRAACRGAGLLDNGDKGFDDFAVDIKDNASNSDYLAKQDSSKHWGADREIAKATSKNDKTGKKGRHPFALLEDSSAGDEKAGRLYLEYALHMQGKRQIYWSPGLKKRVGIADKKDEEIEQESREKAIDLGSFEDAEWDLVRKAGAGAHILSASEAGGWASVMRCIERLKKAKEKRKMTTFKQFCEHYDLDLDDPKSKTEYRRYIDNLHVLQKLDKQEGPPDKQTKQ